MANKQGHPGAKQHNTRTDAQKNSLEVNGTLSTAKKRRLRKKRSIARQNIELEQSQIEFKRKVIDLKPVKKKVPEPVCELIPNKIEDPFSVKSKSDHESVNKIPNSSKNSIHTCNNISNDKAFLISKNNMASKDISKEEILAQRKSKKLLKQNAKTKQTKVAENSNPNIDIKNDLCVIHDVNSTKETKIPNVVQVTKTKDESMVKKPAADTNLNTKEQSREQVLAEREAKKLAKLAKKKNLGPEKDLLLNATSTKKNDTLPPVDSIEDTKMNVLATEVNHINFREKSDEMTVSADAKSKAELRAERRAKQEAQRAAKEISKQSDTITAEKKIHGDTTKKLEIKAVKIAESGKPAGASISDRPKTKSTQNLHQVKLFQHLYAEREATLSIPRLALNTKDVHPAIVRLGVQNASRVIVGSNARCIAFLNAIKQVVTDFVLPAKAEFTRGLEAHLKPSLAFLKSTRPLAVSMINALKHFRWQLAKLPNAITEYDAKTELNEAIDTYIREQVEVAGQAISNAVRNKISNRDVILIYGCSSLIERILKDAWKSGLHFRTVVVGSRSSRDGVEMLRRLTVDGLPCTYINISALSYVMGRVNKVLLGAGALLVNGSVMARAGTSQVALVANAYNVPVLVCCETHKFSERVQTDSFVYNELGEPDDLMEKGNEKSPLRDWQSVGSLTPLNLTYDVTPPNLVTAVVTELAILPCTSVPVVLRFK